MTAFGRSLGALGAWLRALENIPNSFFREPEALANH